VKLTQPQAERFYVAWWPLLSYVNQRLHIAPARPLSKGRSPFTAEEALAVRNALWADDSLLEAFVAENPDGLPDELLAQVASWKHRRSGLFFIWKHYKKHTIFLQDKTAYAVLGLFSTLEEILPQPPPTVMDAVLLPFEGVIVVDGLLTGPAMSLGPGIRRNLRQEYADIVERGAVLTSLLPEAPAAARAKRGEGRAQTNRKVVDAFRRHLFTTRLREETVARDVRLIDAFGRGLPGDRTLRDFTVDDVEGMVAAAATILGDRAATVSALKRFLKFLMETDRMDPPEGREALDWLRAYG
jgi:hypothetical protein